MTTVPHNLSTRLVRGLFRISRRSLRICCIVLALAGVALLVACSSAEQRYKTLSFFFDGVPNPNAAARIATTQPETTGPVVITASIVSRHKPYMDGNCNACHRNAAGNIMDFADAYQACLKCHKAIPTQLPLMHGPVARGDCKWCHVPHESNQPYLLKDNSIKVCTQCHDAKLLGKTPIQHTDGVTSCLQCHFGHGGTARFFLKPDPGLQSPATGPATQAAAPGAPAAPSGPGAASSSEPATQPTLRLAP